MTKKLATCKILPKLVYSFPHGDMLLVLKGERFPNQCLQNKTESEESKQVLS